MKMEFQRYIFFIAVVCMSGCSAPKAQVQSKGTIKREYDVIFNQLPSRLQNAYGEGVNIAIARLADMKEDTLNLVDKITTGVKITTGITDNYIRVSNYPNNDSGYVPVYACEGHKKHGVLTVTLNDGFHNSAITHQIKGQNVVSTYSQFSDKGPSFKLDLNGKMLDSITIPANTRIQFYRAKSNPNVVYCKVNMITQPYYVADNFFKSGYVKKQVIMEYYLKADLKN